MRNALIQPLTVRLSILQANRENKRIVQWCAQDTPVSGEWTRGVATAMLNVPSSHTEGSPGIMLFFPGCPCTFATNGTAAEIDDGQSKNCLATMVHLVLDPEEPPETAEEQQRPYRKLKYVPLAIVVKPDSRADGTLIVVERTERSLTVSLNQKTGRHQQERRAGGITYRFKRLGFCLLSGYAFTDYWTQGMSFGHDCWLSHLTPPPTGKVKRPSIYVVSSRHEDRPAWIPIAPLWPPGDTQRRAKVIQIYFEATKIEPQLKAELQRLRALAARTPRPQLHSTLPREPQTGDAHEVQMVGSN